MVDEIYPHTYGEAVYKAFGKALVLCGNGQSLADMMNESGTLNFTVKEHDKRSMSLILHMSSILRHPELSTYKVVMDEAALHYIEGEDNGISDL